MKIYTSVKHILYHVLSMYTSVCRDSDKIKK